MSWINDFCVGVINIQSPQTQPYQELHYTLSLQEANMLLVYYNWGITTYSDLQL